MDAPERLSPKALAALYASATLASLAVGPDGPRYWDSFGYVIQALTGRVGGLMLGRPTFVLLSHGVMRVWRAAGGCVDAAEFILRSSWMSVSASGAVAMALVARGVGLSPRAAFGAGLMLAFSPTVAHSSRAVLTDAPSMAVTLWAFALGLRAVRSGSVLAMLLAGASLGVAAGMREQALLHVVSLVALAACAPSRRTAHAFAALVGSTIAFGAPVLWLATTRHGYLGSVAGWIGAMRAERSQHPYGARDFGMFVVWAFASSPVAWVLLARVARRGLASWRNDSLRSALVVPSLLQFAALAFYQDIAFSPRYLLAAVPCAVVLPAAAAFETEGTPHTRGLWAVALAVLLVAPVPTAAFLVSAREKPLRDGLAALPGQLSALPPRSAVVTGQLCPAVVYHRELARLRGEVLDVVQVCPGWRWPGDLGARLDALRSDGRTVVVDLRATSWLGERQRLCMREAARYVADRSSAAGVTVWR